MRFIHIADLHLGKSMHGVSMIDNKDQVVWLDHFLQCVARLKPDAVVIAGDIYDRSAPSGDAVLLFDDMITALEGMDIPVFAIAGNHDSGQRLSFAGDILAKQKVYLSGILEKEMTHITLPDTDGFGPVTFWLMPYLFPALAAQKLEDDSINSYDMAVRRFLEEQNIDYTKRNVLVAHQNVTADGREVERGGSESMVGGVGQVDYTAFDGFDYVALGHIHSSYHVGRREVRYAGSPLCYHFNETRQAQKGPILVEMGEKGAPLKIETQIIEPLHVMREIKGTFEEIREDAETGAAKNEYLKLVLTDRRITPEAAEMLRGLYKARGSIVMEFTSEFREYDSLTAMSYTNMSEQKSVEEYFAELYQERKPESMLSEEDWQLLRFAGELVGNADTAGQRDLVSPKDAGQLLNYILKQET